jgi:DNA-binding PadR family transcriptional regulator
MPVSIGMGLLAILAEGGPSYGLRLRNEFEARTGGIWPLNVGQVYTTLGRLERDGLVTESAPGPEGQRIYEATEAGQACLETWFAEPTVAEQPARDEVVIKIILAAARGIAPSVIQNERRAALQTLQGYTRLKRDDRGDVGWLFLLESLIIQTEARVRWLDTCDARLRRMAIQEAPVEPAPVADHSEMQA